MKDKLQMINQHEHIDLVEKINSIYKWHNGLALVEDLKAITDDNTFEFLPNELKNGYMFENSKNQRIILNESGKIIASDVGENPIFIQICQQRLDKTEKMINSLNFKAEPAY